MISALSSNEAYVTQQVPVAVDTAGRQTADSKESCAFPGNETPSVQKGEITGNGVRDLASFYNRTLQHIDSLRNPGGLPLLERDIMPRVAPEEKAATPAAGADEKALEAGDAPSEEGRIGIDASALLSGKKEARPGMLKRVFESADDSLRRVKSANYEREVGSYKLKVDYMDYRVRVKPKVKPEFEDGKLGGKASLGLETKVDLLRTELSRTEQRGDWTVSQGVRGGFRAHEVDTLSGERQAKDGETSWTTERERTLSADVLAFRRWDKDLGSGRHLRLDAAAGATHDFAENNTALTATFRQELSGKDAKAWGMSYDWSVEAKEQVGYATASGEFGASYEVYAGVSKKFPIRMFGHTVNASLKAGPQIEGDQDEAFKFKPVVKLGVKF
ncbi:MAG: hypothetical protein RDV48_20380 [Candidatus Eremiobacteraeota bacterium]|nr:hypothetical protein [Candidatus Eremiobacteraeota bacterium]